MHECTLWDQSAPVMHCEHVVRLCGQQTHCDLDKRKQHYEGMCAEGRPQIASCSGMTSIPVQLWQGWQQIKNKEEQCCNKGLATVVSRIGKLWVVKDVWLCFRHHIVNPCSPHHSPLQINPSPQPLSTPPSLLCHVTL